MGNPCSHVAASLWRGRRHTEGTLTSEKTFYDVRSIRPYLASRVPARSNGPDGSDALATDTVSLASFAYLIFGSTRSCSCHSAAGCDARKAKPAGIWGRSQKALMMFCCAACSDDDAITCASTSPTAFNCATPAAYLALVSPSVRIRASNTPNHCTLLSPSPP